MKKISALLTTLFVAGILMGNAQSGKKEPPPPPPKVNMTKFKPPVLTEQGKQHNEFMKRNPTVANIEWKDSLNTIIKLKNKKIEPYNLGMEAEKKVFLEKYGTPPIPPPPPKKVIDVRVQKKQ